MYKLKKDASTPIAKRKDVVLLREIRDTRRQR
jgi:hypothetical protein